MTLLIGCPVLQRAWSIPGYFEGIREACRAKDSTQVGDLRPEFVFVGDPDRDPETWAAIHEHAIGPVHTVYAAEPTRTEDVRDWGTTPGRFKRMAELRNAMMAKVRELAPTYFLSLDSDIVLHPDALVNLLETSERFDAVGGKLYMDAGTKYPSYGLLGEWGGLRRPESSEVMEVDVLMACVLMTPSAFEVAYGSDPMGEDIFWSLAAKAAGLRLGWDGRACNTHRFVKPAEVDA